MFIKNVEIKKFKGLGSVLLKDCGKINAIVGKNNSGKSSILHAIDIAGLALSVNRWDYFQPKLEIKDLFADIGEFAIKLSYEDDSSIEVKTNDNGAPIKRPEPNERQKFKSILILPDVGTGMLQRQHKTPRWIVDQLESRNFAAINSLDILYAIKFYAIKNERGLTPQVYEDLLNEIKNYFPEIEALDSNRTEHDIATLTYTEYGKQLDILYSGSGLKHFIDVLLKTTISNANVVLLDEPEMGLHPDMQRRFIDYLVELSTKKNIQIFMATHAPVLLNYADSVTYYRILNSAGERSLIPVPGNAIHTLLSDMGLRPSDIFNQDICLMVEGASEVVFFEHIIRNLYKDEFNKVSIGVLQYGGSAAEGIISGSINVSNIVSAQKYTYWIRDRDAKPAESPSTNATQFKNALNRQGLECHILENREIEYYYPKELLKEAQQGDKEKESKVAEIKDGDQAKKFREIAGKYNICVPSGIYLKRLLNKHLTDKSQINPELEENVIQKLISWKNQIL